MDHDDVIVPDRDNVIAMYHDHNIMMGPGKETVTDHDHGITMGHDDGALTVRNGVTIMDRGHVSIIRRVGETMMDPDHVIKMNHDDTATSDRGDVPIVSVQVFVSLMRRANSPKVVFWKKIFLSYFGVGCWFIKSFNENRGSMSKIRHVFQTCLISSSVAGSSRGVGGTRK